VKKTSVIIDKIRRFPTEGNERGILLGKIREILKPLTPEDKIELIEEIIELAYKGEFIMQRIILFFTDKSELDSVLGGDLKKIIELISGSQKRFLWFLEGDEKKVDTFNPEFPRFKEIEELSLGHKKFYARQYNFKLVEKLAYDTNPDVIRNLLQNPALREIDVLKIASRRPVNPEVIREIVKSDKWFSRYKIRLAIVLNPYTPQSVAIAIIPSLMKQDIIQILTTPGLYPIIYQAASFALNPS